MKMRVVFAGVAAGALLLGACGDAKDDTTAQPTTAASTVATTQGSGGTTTTAQATTAAATPTTATQSDAKVSANNATRAQLEAAFTAAGLTGAAQWAKEVEEYRPYPVTDPTMAKLRQNLVKYNPGPGVVDKIVATLSLP